MADIGRILGGTLIGAGVGAVTGELLGLPPGNTALAGATIGALSQSGMFNNPVSGMFAGTLAGTVAGAALAPAIGPWGVPLGASFGAALGYQAGWQNQCYQNPWMCNGASPFCAQPWGGNFGCTPCYGNPMPYYTGNCYGGCFGGGRQFGCSPYFGGGPTINYSSVNVNIFNGGGRWGGGGWGPCQGGYRPHYGRCW